MIQNQNDTPLHEYLLLAVILLCLCWQSCAALIAMCVVLGARVFPIKTSKLLIIGSLIAITALFVNLYFLQGATDIASFFLEGFRKNKIFFKLMTHYDLSLAWYYQLHYAWTYLFGFPIFMAAVIQTLAGFGSSGHATILKHLSQGKLASLTRHVHPKRLKKKLAKLKDEDYDGTLLGVSQETGQPVVVPDKFVNQIVLVLGTTGGGKTITLRRFFARAVCQHYPLIIIDGKPEHNNIKHIQELAKRMGSPFYGFNCANFMHYNPLSHGGYTELKDKIMTLKDDWESDYYKTIAADYLQTALEVLIKTGQKIDLALVARCLDFATLIPYVREVNDPLLAERVKGLQYYDQKSLSGLQTHLNVLVHSEQGSYLTADSDAFDLKRVIDENAVAYFALPVLKYSDFAPVLGKLVINDIKSVVEPLEGKKPIFTVFDEFSVFAGKQVLHLVDKGRSKGIHSIFGTQGLAELREVDETFECRLLNCVNTLICHRLNDAVSAQAASEWIGTKDSFDVTAQVGTASSNKLLGSVNKNKVFIVHPELIKQDLDTGECFYVSRVKKGIIDRVKVKF